MVSDAKAAKMLDNRTMITAAIARMQGTRAAKVSIMSCERISQYWLAVQWRLANASHIPPALHRAYVTLGDGRKLHAQEHPPRDLPVCETKGYKC